MDEIGYQPVGLGEDNNFPNNWLRDNTENNISKKNIESIFNTFINYKNGEVAQLVRAQDS